MTTIQRSLALIIVACCGLFASASGADAPTQAASELHRLFADEWTIRLRDDPLFATQAGVNNYNDRLPSVTPTDYLRQLGGDQEYLRRLHALDRAALGKEDRLNYDLFEFVLKHRVALAPFRAYRTPMLSDDGFHIAVAHMADGVAMRSTRDFEMYIARLHAVPAYFEQNIANMRQGMADGFTLPSVILPGIIAVIDGQQYATPADSPLYQPFNKMPDTIDAGSQERLREAGRAAIEKDVIPAYRKLREFMLHEYSPRARASIAAAELPEGKEYYAALVRFFTNLDVTPEEVHKIGLAEVERIRAEMIAVIQKTGFKGDFAAFLGFLRTDPRFYAKTPDELLKDASYIAKQIDGMLPAYFGRLPRMTYSVQPVPADLAPNYTGGRYVPAPIGGTHGGEYWVNTYALEKRPLYALTSLTLHEAVPGHHLQGALARELDNVPPFRLDLYPHAFGEGWGLYSEKLGIEMGLYRTPYDEFGRLTYEMWRACRLVVDTGMHSMGWSRERALDYLASNTALSTQEVRTETDRYIAWPGQALAYKMGELKILELRARAQKALGARFDIRAFHDAVLANGGVPLPILEQQIDAYIAAAQR
jgi:uncharacterized protein (DUF885 family)